MEGIEDAAVHRLETVPHIRQGAAHYNGHGIVYIACLHLLHQLRLGNDLIGEEYVFRFVISLMCHIYSFYGSLSKEAQLVRTNF